MKKMLTVKHPRYSLANSEHGAIMLLMVLLITGMIGVVALVVDSSREQLTMNHLQSTSDAAAIAAATQLDGTFQGWAKAKRAAVASLRANMIYGAAEGLDTVSFDPRLITPLVDPAQIIDPNELTPKYQGTIAEVGNLRISVQRGVYWQNGFRPLEEPLEGELPGHFLMLPVHLIANAVQVSIHISDVPTYFASVFGFTDYNLLASAVGLMDREIEAEVAPIAIPACSLLLNTNRSAAENSYLELGDAVYYADKQCERQVLATEANHENPNRTDGMTRAASYPRRPYDYTADPALLNSRAIPVEAVLGIPGSTDRTIDGEDLAAYFLNGGVAKAKLGNRFFPLDQADTKFLNDPIVEGYIANMISQGGTTFGQVFGAGKEEKPNYPHVRHYGNELKFVWPSSQNQNDTILMVPQGAASWSNPACHSAKLLYNTIPPDIDFEELMPADLWAPVKEVNVMVIAPNPEPGSQYEFENYCDFVNVFTGDRQESVPPVALTNPTIVGFVKAYLYDFNIMWNEPEVTPIYYQEGFLPLVDNNPGRLPNFKDYSKETKEFIDQYRDFKIDHKEWDKCLNCQVCPPGCNPWKDDNSSCPDERCKSTCPDPNTCGDMPDQPTVPAYSPAIQECFKTPRTDEDRTVIIDENTEGGCADKEVNGGYCPWGDSKDGKHCLPKKIDNCFPETDPDCWEDIRDRAPQYGCGGLRLALDCTKTTIPMVKSLAERQPALTLPIPLDD